ncbi:MAG TPA: hypothetical protein VFZ06_13040 [Acidimicrobiia bacterium]|nr:hypothetical protein [Acidimicrobiia bacterium]
MPGNGVYFCDRCVDLCKEIVDRKLTPASNARSTGTNVGVLALSTTFIRCDGQRRPNPRRLQRSAQEPVVSRSPPVYYGVAGSNEVPLGPL